VSSSVREKMAAQIKEAKRSVVNATEERLKPSDNQQKHSQVEVGGSSAVASSGDILSSAKKPPSKLQAGGLVKKFSPIAKPQRFSGVL
jgi:hypothetical protein